MSLQILRSAAGLVLLSALLTGQQLSGQERPSRPAGPARPGPSTPQRSPATAPKGTATVSGRIVGLDTGLPLRRARVSVRGMRLGQAQTTLSNADGTFAFTQLAADRYQMRASKARYADGALGARRPGGQGRPFELADGQRLTGVSVSLSPGGVIVGRVVDEYGEPVARATVAAMRQQRTLEGELGLMPAGFNDTTDDTGTYRLYGLVPGRYVVVVRAGETDRLAANADDLAGYPQSFFPGTSAASEAQLIEVAAGSETAADVTLTPATLATVRGTIVDAVGRPARGGMTRLRTSTLLPGFAGGGGGGVDEHGTFIFRHVAPGEYVVTAHAVFSREAADDRTFRGEGFAVPLSVGSADIPDMRIVVPAATTVSGRVIYEGEAGGTGASLSLTGARGLMGSSHARIGVDGRFTLQVTPGPRTVEATGGRGWMLKQLTWKGREVDAGGEIGIDAEGGRLEAVFTRQLTAITGSVTDANGRAVEDYQVVLFPEDALLLRRGRDRVRFERPDQQGRFRTEGLRPGRYLALATVDLEPEDALDPEVFDVWRRAATPVRLAVGETQTLTLTLAPLP